MRLDRLEDLLGEPSSVRTSWILQGRTDYPFTQVTLDVIRRKDDYHLVVLEDSDEHESIDVLDSMGGCTEANVGDRALLLARLWSGE